MSSFSRLLESRLSGTSMVDAMYCTSLMEMDRAFNQYWFLVS